ncbi:MAG: SPOR domain-containing protein [Burkholderiaceae bacterium]|jgi:DedD protein
MPTDFGSSSSAYRSTDLDGADPGADQKRRARWRLLGASVFSLAVATAAYQLMLQEPRPLAQDFVVLMPVGDAQVPSRGLTQPAERPAPPQPSETAQEVRPSQETGPAASALTAERVEAPVVVAVTPSPSSSASAANAGDAKSSARQASSGSGAGGSRAWFVQLGAYDSREAAAAMATKVRGLGYSATVQDAPSSQGTQGTLYRVRVGPFNEAQAKAYLERVRAQGYASFLVRP